MASKIIVSEIQVRKFIERCMFSVGSSKQCANDLADNLLEADIRGHSSHGLARLGWLLKKVVLIYLYSYKGMYASATENGAIINDGEPTIVKETPATAVVDGKNIIGATVGKFSMQVAIEKAKSVGIGFVVANSKFSNVFCYNKLIADIKKILHTTVLPVIMVQWQRNMD